MEVPKAWHEKLWKEYPSSLTLNIVFKMSAEPLPVPTQSSQLPVQG